MKSIFANIYNLLRCHRINRNIKFGSFWNFIHGFSEETIFLNGINKDNYKSFLSDRAYRLGHPWNGTYSSIIDNKLYLPYLLKDYPEHTPMYFYFLNNNIQELGGAGNITFEEFLLLLRKQKRLVLKHICSSLGNGFHLLEYIKEDKILLDTQYVNEIKLRHFLYSLKDYIVSEYVQQHQYAQEVNSSSLNTIRMLCVRDKRLNTFNVVRCFHRFGSNGSLVDNLGGGNACLHFVDIATGIVESAGMVNINNQGEQYSEHVIHPSGRDLTGLKIPSFNEIKDKVLEISNSFPFLKYVGWDIAITEKGFKIIEANSLTSLGILQRKGGYLDDPILKDIFVSK